MDDGHSQLGAAWEANDVLEHKLLVAKRALENISGIAATEGALYSNGKLVQVHEMADQALVTIAKVPA